MFTRESESMSRRIVLMVFGAALAVSPSRLPSDDSRRRKDPDPRLPALPAGVTRSQVVITPIVASPDMPRCIARCDDSPETGRFRPLRGSDPSGGSDLASGGVEGRLAMALAAAQGLSPEDRARLVEAILDPPTAP